MVAVLVRLKLSLLRNGVRRSVWKLVGLVIGGLYALAVVVFAAVGLVALRWAGPQIAGDVTVVAFSAITLGWLIMSLLVYGVDETVDPGRFAVLPVRATQLMPGLLLAAMIGLPGLVCAIVALALLGTWSLPTTTGIAPLVSLIVVIPVGLVLNVLWSRALTAAFTRALSSRRFRDVAIVLFTLIMVSFGLMGSAIARGITDLSDPLAVLHRVAQTLSWTPFGWIWGVPGALAAGEVGGALLRVVLAAALVVALAWLWVVMLARALTSPIVPSTSSREVRSSRLVGRLFPASPAGAIAARSLTYWRRDPRYLAALVALVVTPLLLVGSSMISGEGARPIAVLAPLLMAWLGGVMVASDLSYDGSAISLHVLAGVRGMEDRLGRAMAAATLVVPLLVIVAACAIALSGQSELAPVVIAGTTVLFLAGLGGALWVGTFVPGKAPPPGSNPFAASNGGGLQSMLSMAMVTGIATAAALPTAGLLIAAFVAHLPLLAWVGVLVAAITGVAVLYAGIRVGGKTLEARWPELLAQVSQH